MLIDPQSAYVQNGVNAMRRAQDDEILQAFFAASATGENGTTSTAFPAGQIVGVNVGGANSNLNVAKLRAAKRLLMAAGVDLEFEKLFVAITAADHDGLLNEIQVTSLDYNNKPTLVEGKVTSFMGFNFIPVEFTDATPTTPRRRSSGGNRPVPHGRPARCTLACGTTSRPAFRCATTSATRRRFTQDHDRRDPHFRRRRSCRSPRPADPAATALRSPWPRRATTDNICCAVCARMTIFAFGIITASATLGDVGDRDRHQPGPRVERPVPRRGTFTAVDTPTLFGLASAISNQTALTAPTPIYLTIATAALPGAGTLVIDIFHSNG
jgi:hypothetical protein